MADDEVRIAGRRVVIDGRLAIPGRWLRDHGEDAASVNPDTGQRRVDTFAIDPDVTPVAVSVERGWMEVGWSDGGRTGHHLDALRRVASARRQPAVRTHRGFAIPAGLHLWGEAPEPRWFDAEVLDDDAAWPDALDHLRHFGWAAFEGAALGDAATRALAGRIGYPRSSIFGDVWQMNAGEFQHQDSAYESFALDLHTDGTYSHDAPGTIIFAQQRRSGDGGDSVLVDGFAAARDLQAANPEAADLLTRFAIRSHYREPGVHLVAERPPLRVDHDGDLAQVSFNNYDRAPLLPDAGLVDAVIDAYAELRAVITDPARALRHPWRPGRLLVVDNWRCLHGRSAFVGSREFIGCYTNHEDLESAFRVAGATRRR